MSKVSLSGIRVKTENDPVRHQHRHIPNHPRMVQHKDGTVAVLRPGFRPRILSKDEVEALKNGGADGS